jgi:hypothetical protein
MKIRTRAFSILYLLKLPAWPATQRLERPCRSPSCRRSVFSRKRATRGRLAGASTKNGHRHSIVWSLPAARPLDQALDGFVRRVNLGRKNAGAPRTAIEVMASLGGSAEARLETASFTVWLRQRCGKARPSVAPDLILQPGCLASPGLRGTRIVSTNPQNAPNLRCRRTLFLRSEVRQPFNAHRGGCRVAV